MGFDSDKPRCVSHFLCLFTMLSCPGALTSLGLSYLVYIVEITRPLSEGTAEIKRDKTVKHLAHKRHPIIKVTPPSPT